MKKSSKQHLGPQSPKCAQYLIKRFLIHYTETSLPGDLEEEFRVICSKSGFKKARVWYWRQVLKSLPFLIKNFIYWSFAMLKNYLKIGGRFLIRHKGYSFINIAGLAVGMAACLLISLWVLDELSFDRFHEHADVLYRVEFYQDYSGKMFHVNVSPHPLAPVLKAEIPEIEDATRITFMGEMLFRHGDNKFFEDSIFAVDPVFFHMFTFPLAAGDVQTVLNDPFSVVVSENIAKKYFGNEHPLGKVFTVNNKYDFTVTGVMKNVPANSSLQFEILLPYDLFRATGKAFDNWNNNSILTFIKMRKHSFPGDTGEKIKSLLGKHRDVKNQYYSIRPITDIHLFSHFGFGNFAGNIQYIYIFSMIALFILIIACINFMNLSTARSCQRAREVGMRKVIGAVKSQVIRQFYIESCIYTFFALVLAFCLVGLLLPVFNTLSGKAVSLSVLTNGSIPLIIFGITLFTGIVAGSYPALFLSAFRPIKVLRGSTKTGAKGSLFRKTLVVVQFALSIGLIIGTGVIYNQLGFIKGRNLGFDKDFMIYLPLRGGVSGSYDVLKEELKKNLDVIEVSAADTSPSGIYSNSGGADWEGKDPEKDVSLHFTYVDFDYFKAAGMEMKEGRAYSMAHPTDMDSAFVVNEEVVKLMDVDSALGRSFSFGDRTGTIIGVVKNFHFQSLKRTVEPLILLLTKDYLNVILVRISAQNMSAALGNIEKTWNKVLPNVPFEYNFPDEEIKALYQSEERMGDVLKYFTILAVFIACLGLFGLASFAAEQKTKEVGIRKILGASVSRIIFLMCREFMLLLSFAVVVAWPISYFVMRTWLQDFAYRTPFRVEIFVGAAGLAFVIALTTVSFQAFKAAFTNPVDALRYE